MDHTDKEHSENSLNCQVLTGTTWLVNSKEIKRQDYKDRLLQMKNDIHIKTLEEPSI